METIKKAIEKQQEEVEKIAWNKNKMLIDTKKIQEVMDKVKKYIDRLNLSDVEIMFIITEMYKNVSLLDEISRAQKIMTIQAAGQYKQQNGKSKGEYVG